MSGFVYREPGKIVLDILQSEMGLSAGQTMLTNTRYEIPPKGLFIVASYLGPSKIIANCNEWQDAVGGGLTEVQSLTIRHFIQIDIMEFGNEARTRKEEIAMALLSVFSQNQQEQYQMQIARMPGAFMDTSYLEGAAILSRYTTTIATTSVLQKSKAVSYYNDFSRAVPPLVTVDA